MRNKRKRIFVSYTFSKPDGTTGFGNNIGFYLVGKNRLTGADIREIEDQIRGKDGLERVVVLNYQFI